MYYRIKDCFDVDMLSEYYENQVGEEITLAIRNRIEMLENAYGQNQPDRTGYGGYVLFFPEIKDYIKTFAKILSNYGLDKDMFEYDDTIYISEDRCWHEKLFLISSDNALVLVYPEAVD